MSIGEERPLIAELTHVLLGQRLLFSHHETNCSGAQTLLKRSERKNPCVDMPHRTNIPNWRVGDASDFGAFKGIYAYQFAVLNNFKRLHCGVPAEVQVETSRIFWKLHFRCHVCLNAV